MGANHQALLMIGGAAYGPNVRLLQHYDGDFTDSSSYARTMSSSGSPDTDAAAAKFGSEGHLHDGGSYTYSTDSSDFHINNLSWSVDCWIYIPSTVSLSSDITITAQWTGASNLGWITAVDSSRRLRWYLTTDGTLATASFETLSASNAVPLDAWAHIAIWYYPTDGKVYGAVDGVIQSFVLHSGPVFNSTDTFRAEGTINDIRTDELRVCIDGIDYAGSNFTPPSAPY